jgi:hypothetical protein
MKAAKTAPAKDPVKTLKAEIVSLKLRIHKLEAELAKEKSKGWLKIFTR